MADNNFWATTTDPAPLTSSNSKCQYLVVGMPVTYVHSFTKFRSLFCLTTRTVSACNEKPITLTYNAWGLSLTITSVLSPIGWRTAILLRDAMAALLKTTSCHQSPSVNTADLSPVLCGLPSLVARAHLHWHIFYILTTSFSGAPDCFPTNKRSVRCQPSPANAHDY